MCLSCRLLLSFVCTDRSLCECRCLLCICMCLSIDICHVHLSGRMRVSVMLLDMSVLYM